MLDGHEFETLSRNLMTALGELAQLRKERTRLLAAGDAAGADQLNVTLNDRSAQILTLSLILMVEAEVSEASQLAPAKLAVGSRQS
jgi:hypothetical protein